MGNVLKDRIREASLLLRDERIEALGAAIERLAGSRLSVDETLSRVRIAHLLPESDQLRDRLIEQINSDGPLVERNDDQLIAVLAACTLIELFGRTEPSRSPAVTRRLAIAALAVRTLVHSSFQPAHPDLRSWADYWLYTQGTRLREVRRSQPPKINERLEQTEPPSLEPLIANVEQLQGHAVELSDWLERIAGAASIEALREQNQILWWLTAAGPQGEGAEVAIGAAQQLDAMSLTPPPPASRELLKRRLRGVEEETVESDEFDRHRKMRADLERSAKIVPELTPILAGGLGSKQMSAARLAHALYEEIVLARLVDEERRQEELRRQQARARAVELAADQQAEEQPQQ